MKFKPMIMKIMCESIFDNYTFKKTDAFYQEGVYS